MALFSLSLECSDQPMKLGDLFIENPADHAACPVKRTTPGVIGGWVCSCPCHRELDVNSTRI